MIRRILVWVDVVACLVILSVAVAFKPHTLCWFIGNGLAFVTFPFWLVARFQLGSSFSIKAKAKQLVTTGLYAKISHPIYLFGCLAYIGALLALQSWLILAIWFVVIIPVELIRIRREDQVLRDAFGEEFERYRSRVWF